MKQLLEARANVNATTRFRYSALHWACLYGRHDVVGTLIEKGCSTDLLNHRGETAWDIARALPLTNSSRDAVLAMFSDACKAKHKQLCQEKIRRKERSKVQDTFHDDVELDPVRLDFWAVEPFDKWEQWPAETAKARLASTGQEEPFFQKQVFSIQVDPETVQPGGRRFRRIMLLRVRSPHAVNELRKEVETLRGFSHQNVAQILGVVHSRTPASGEYSNWSVAVEWCDTALTHLLYHEKLVDPDGNYTTMAQKCELCEQIVQGLAYLHAKQRPYLHLNLDNVLLAKDGTSGNYVAKLGEFRVGDGYKDKYENKSTDAEAPVGDWEYMSPECWKRKYGEPSNASDIFSFGLLMWEMLARRRICPHLLDNREHTDSDSVLNPEHTFKLSDLAKAYQRVEGLPRLLRDEQVRDEREQVRNECDVRNITRVPVLFAKGERPRFTGLLPEVQEQCGVVYYRLMQACWVAEMGKRPTAALVADALRLAKSYVRSEQTEQEIAALKAEVGTPAGAPSADTRNGEAAITYDDFLAMVGVQDKKAELTEYLTEGAELKELKQMDTADLDKDILDDLGLDEETKTQFHEKLQALKQAPAADEPMAADDKELSEFNPDVVDAAARAAAEREARWPKWPTLQKMLPGLRGLQDEAQPLELAATHS
eukprot:COSAG03_NODE_772_length_5921_cov_517.392477_1_plen_654_part_00